MFVGVLRRLLEEMKWVVVGYDYAGGCSCYLVAAFGGEKLEGILMVPFSSF